MDRCDQSGHRVIVAGTVRMCLCRHIQLAYIYWNLISANHVLVFGFVVAVVPLHCLAVPPPPLLLLPSSRSATTLRSSISLSSSPSVASLYRILIFLNSQNIASEDALHLITWCSLVAHCSNHSSPLALQATFSLAFSFFNSLNLSPLLFLPLQATFDVRNCRRALCISLVCAFKSVDKVFRRERVSECAPSLTLLLISVDSVWHVSRSKVKMNDQFICGWSRAKWHWPINRPAHLS